MKKRICFLLLILAIVFSFAACGDDDDEEKKNQEKESIVSIESLYTQGDSIIYESNTLDLLRSNLKVYTVNGKGEKAEVTDYTLSGSLTAGTSRIKVSYRGFTDSISVQVTSVNLASISASYNQNGKTVYTSGTLDSLRADVVVTGTNNDGSTFTVSNYTLSGSLTAGNSSITVSYGPFSCIFDVNVTAVIPTSISISKNPSKTHYIETEELDLSGMTVLVRYNDGTSGETVSYSCEKTAVLLEDESITVSYGDLKASFPITVEKKIVSLSVSKNPEKLSYISGEKLDLSGIEITAHYLNGTSEIVTDALPNITNGAYLSVTDNLTYSKQSVSVSVPIEINYVEYEDYLLSYTYESASVRSRALIQEIIRFKISKYVGEAAKIVIPEECAGIPITEIDNFAFIDSNVLMIKIGSNITTVHSDSFAGCQNTVICPEFSEKPEGWADDWNSDSAPVVWAFHSIVIDDYFDYGISSGKVYITAYKGLSPVVIIPEEIEGIPVASVCASFSGNSILTNIILPDSLEEIGDYAFNNCSNLKSVTIPNSVESIGSRAFYNCESLTSVTIPRSVKSIGDSAFYSCYRIKEVYIGDIEAWCNISFGSSYANPLCYADNLYLNGTLVTELEIPNTVKAIKAYAFWGCASLTTVTIPNSVEAIGSSVFNRCTSLTSIKVSENNQYYKDIDGNLYSKDGKILVQYAIGKSNTEFTIPDGVESIGNSAFYYCTSLTSVTIPNSVVSIGDSAFSVCRGLTSVIIGNSVESIGSSAFASCSSLTSVTIGNGVKSIGDDAFFNCSSLTSVTIPDSVTGIGSYAFAGCSKLTSIICASKYRADRWDIGWIYGCNATVSYLTVEAEIKTNPDYDYVIVEGAAILTNYKGSSSEIIIPEVIDGTYSVVDFGEIFRGKNIVSIVIPNMFTEIKPYAFYHCTDLTSVTIPNSVVSIGDDAFCGCTSLTSVTIPDSVVSIGWSAFSNCDSLTSVTIPDSVVSIGWRAFSDCTSLTSVTIGNGVESIGYSAFSDCTGLTSVTVGSSVKSIGGYAFYNCKSLTSVTIPNSVVSIGYDAFYSCYRIKEVYIGDIEAWCNISFGGIYANPLCYAYNLYLNGTLVTELEIPNTVKAINTYAFYNCDNLTSVTIPSSVVSIGDGAFSECDNLTTLDIPKSVTYLGTNIVYGCSSLRSIILPTTVDNLSGDFFGDCSALAEIYIREGNNIYRSIEGNLYSASGKIFIRYMNNASASTFVIPDGVIRIDNDAFSGCKYLVKIIIPESVESIGERAFSNCSSLTSVTIPRSIKSISDDAFYSCSRLKEVHIGDIEAWCNISFSDDDSNPLSYAGNLYLNGTLVTELEIPNAVKAINAYAFYSCDNLTSVTIPNSVKSIGDDAFCGCTSLTSVTIPNSVKSIGDYAFRGCTSLTSVTIPNSIKSIGERAFSNCSSLTIVTIPDSVVSIGDDAFRGCTSLTSVTIPNSVESIGGYAFYDCDSLTSIKVSENNRYYKDIDGNLYSKDGKILIQYAIGKSDTEFTIPDGVVSIGDYAFYYCTSLTSVTIPNSVVSIGSHAFASCDSLTSVTIPDSVTGIGSYALSGCSKLTNVTCASKYRADGWDSGWIYGCNATVSYLTVEAEIKTNPDYDYVIVEGVAILTNYKGFSNEIIIPEVIDGTYSVVDFGEIFRGKNIVSIVIPNTVTEIKDFAFYYCTGLTSVTIGKGVESIGNLAFYWCSRLKEVHIGDIEAWCNISFSDYDSNPLRYAGNLYLNGTLVTELEIPNTVKAINAYAFYNCESLTSVTIPNSVVSIGDYAFCGCTGLTSLTIPDSVESIGNSAFASCYSLTSVTIPNSVESIGWSAFYSCESLMSVTIGNGVKSISDDAFYSCSRLKEVHIGDIEAWCNISFSDDDSNPLSYAGNLYLNGTLVTELEIPNTVKAINAYAFYGCDSLTSVTIPNSVNSIGSSVFDRCINLTSIKVLENNQYYKDINGNLYSKDGKILIQYAIGKSDTDFIIPDGVTSIGEHAFSGCPNLTSISIPNSVESIGSRAFSNCSSLTSVTIPNSVKSIGGHAFDSCESLTSVTIPDSVESIGNSAFASCYSLTSVTIPNSVKSIGDYAFCGCTGLTSLTIPDSVESIGNSAFASCYSLTSVTIPNSVKSIGDNAFYYCTSLTSVTIPNSVEYIGKDAFEDCSRLYIFFTGIKSDYKLEENWNPDNRPVYWNSIMYESTSEFYCEIAEGTAKIVKYIGKGGEVLIPDVINIGGKVYFVTEIADGAFDDIEIVTSIVIGANVRKISGSAFTNCEKLTSVYFAENNDYYKIENDILYTKNGKELITAMPYLSGNVILPEWVEIIHSKAFEGCDSVTSVFIPKTVKTVASLAFFGADGLKEITVSEENAYYSSENGILFSEDMKIIYCYPQAKEGTNYTIPSSVTYVESYCFNNSSLKYILLVDKDTTVRDYSFIEGQKIIVPQRINVFKGTVIEVPDVEVIAEVDGLVYAIQNGEKATLLGSVNNVTNVIVPENVTYNNAQYTVTVISTHAFYSCDSLTSITIPKSVEYIGSVAFLYCSSLKEVYIGDIEAWCNISFGSSYANPLCCAGNLYLNGTLVTELEIPNTVKAIKAYAFWGCASLTTVTIPNGVESIGEWAFSNCSSLTSVTIPNSVESIGERAFSNCSNLTTVTIPDSVESIGGYAFSECTNLTSIKYDGTEEQWNAIQKGDDWDYNTGDYTITYNYISK